MAAPGPRTLTTPVNIPGATYIDDDFAFATRDGLIVEIKRNVAPAGYESLGITAPFTRTKFNFVLQRAVNEDESLPLTRMERVAVAADGQSDQGGRLTSTGDRPSQPAPQAAQSSEALSITR